MSQPQRTFHLLPFLHLVLVIALAAWWGVYFWDHTPSRTIFHASGPSHKQPHRHQDALPLRWIADFEDGAFARFALAAKVAVADLACGLVTVLMVGVGSGVYVRRFDNWLHARTSGQAVAYRGQDLTAATLDANAKRQRGVLR